MTTGWTLLLQIKENKSMFMEVDEEEYAKLVAKRRQEDFVEDDGVEHFLPSSPLTPRASTLNRLSRGNRRLGLGSDV